MAKKSSGNYPNNLAAMRVRGGLNQATVAEKLGVTQPSYSNLESGKSRLTVDRAKKLARILGCQIWELSDDFLAEPLQQGRGRVASAALENHFHESSRSDKKTGDASKQTEKLMAEVTAMDAVLRIVREQAGKHKINADLTLLIYAAVSKHISDFEQRQNSAATDDYIRGVVAAKLEQFTRGRG